MAAISPKWRERYPINAAILDLAVRHGLTAGAVAEIVQASEQTVYSWRRSKPTRAPKMALALLGKELGQPTHPLLRD